MAGLTPFPPIPYQRVNGHELSRTSIDLLWDAIAVVGFTAIDFDMTIAPGISYGSLSKPQARTRGKVTFTASITLYETQWHVIRTYLASKGFAQPGGLGWGEVSAKLTLTYFEASLGPGSQTVLLEGVRVIGSKQSVGDADDQLTRVLTLSVMDIFENGVSMCRENSPLGI